MVPTGAALFQLMATRMRWLGERQVVLGQNIANADTPEYRPRDLDPARFERFVASAVAGPGRIDLVRTRPAHFDGAPGRQASLASAAQPETFEVAPDGNAVVLEEQMAKMSRTAMDYQLMTNLYRKYVGMVRTALGQQG